MALGSASYAQIVKETTWGSFPAAGCRRKIGIASETISQQIGLIPDDTLQGGRSRKGYFTGAQSARGRIMLPMRYENALWALEGVLGSSVSALVATETFIWEHTIKEGLLLPSYSMELGEGDIPAGKVSRILGMKIASATFRIVPGQTEEAYGHIELEVVAKDKDTNTTTGHTPTTTFTVANCSCAGGTAIVTTTADFLAAGVTVGMPISGGTIPANRYVIRVQSATALTIGDADGVPQNSTAFGPVSLTFTLSGLGSIPNVPMPPMFFHSATSVGPFPGVMNDGIASTGIRVRRVEIAIANPLSETYHMQSQNIDEPIPEDFYSARWTIEHEYRNLSLYNAAKLGSVLTPKVRLTHPVDILNSVVANQRRFIEFRSNTTKGATFEVPIEGPGIVTATMEQEAYFDPTDASAITIVARNLEPTAGPPVLA